MTVNSPIDFLSDSPTHVGVNSVTGIKMRRASLYSLIVGSTLVILKIIAWSFTDSLSILSSLADSILDVMASVVNFIAIRYALQPPDDNHRFGHGKAEDLATLAQSTFICGTGVFLLIEGIKRLIAPEPVFNVPLGAAVMAVSMGMSLVLTLYQRRIAKETMSGAVGADAMHYFTDFLTNGGVLVALGLSHWFGWIKADPVIALFIAFYIVIGAYKMAFKAFNNVMDHEFEDSERADIERIVLSHEGVSSIHELRTRRSGIYRFIQFHLDYTDENISLKAAHIISDAIEASLRKAYPQTDILIHQDPPHGDHYT